MQSSHLTLSASEAADGGWVELMRLAAAFPLELLTFGGAINPSTPGLGAIARPWVTAVSYDDVNDLVDGAGDGPLIGLGAGRSLATR